MSLHLIVSRTINIALYIHTINTLMWNLSIVSCPHFSGSFVHASTYVAETKESVHMTEEEVLISRVSRFQRTVCFNVVHSDDAITVLVA